MPRAQDLDRVASDDLADKKTSINEKVYEIMGHAKSSLSSILVNPKVFDFGEKGEEEKILVVVRAHWFTNLSWIITFVLMLFVPALMNFIPIPGEIVTKYKLLISLFWYLVSFAFALEKFLALYFDVVIITDKRVIDIDFGNLLVKKFSEARLIMIQDITSKVSGFFQTIFNYGKVKVQTAGETPEIIFENIPNPEKIIRILQILRDEEIKKNASREGML